MRLLRKAARFGRFFGAFRRGTPADGTANHALRMCRFEELEPRELRAGDLHFGAVYFEEATGDDSAGDRLEITFAGGAPGTQLTSITINGDKLLDGDLTLGDIFFDTSTGGLGSFKSVPLSIVSHDGFTVTGVVVDDGTSLITFQLAGFDAGEKLVFDIDVDEQGLFSSTSVAEGGEFEGSRLTGTFTNAHFEDAALVAVFFDRYDDTFAQAAARSGTQLGLPRDSYTPPHTIDREDRTAGAVTTLVQIPKPITISGRVFDDPNLSNSQDAGEPGIASVSVALLEWNGTTYVATGKTAVTNAVGDYKFEGLLPGKYRVVETQPAGYFSVGSTPGKVSGTTVGVSTSPDILSEITLLGGQDSLRNDFAEVVPGSIRGRVYADPEGDCVFGANDIVLAGVEVQLLDGNGNVLRSTVTTASGQYTFAGLLPATYAVRELQPAGYYQGGQKIGTAGGVISTPDTTSQIVLTAGTGGVDYDFCELIPGSISGRVHADPEGDCIFGPQDIPLSGVTVQLLDSNGNVLETTVTNSLGEYRFDNLAPGIYGVREVQPNGFYHGDQHVGSAGGVIAGDDHIAQIELKSATDAVRYDFCESIPVSLRGRVFADPEGDCVFGPQDAPLAGVVVELLDERNIVVATALTNAEGRYEFTNLEAGTYAVREVQPAGYYQGGTLVGSAGGVVVVDDTIGQIVLTSGTDATNYDFCELIPASVSGRVFADPEADCIFGTRDTPLSGVVVQLLDTSGVVVRTTTTDGGGQYRFENLAPGTYTVHELQPAGFFQGGERAGSHGGVVAGPDVISQIVLGSAAVAVDYDFCELLPGSISGRVHADPEGDCIVGPNDILLSGVAVQLLDGSGNIVATTLTDAQGRYQFSQIAPGAYSVRELQPSGYFHGDQHAGTAGGVIIADDFISQIVIGSGTVAANYDFCELPAGAISGYVFQDGPTISVRPGETIDPNTVRNGVRDASDLPIAGVTLLLGDASGEAIRDATGQPRTAVTDANGFYQFAGLAPGLYTVRQIQPSAYIDFVDTAGTTGGVAVNRRDEISPLMLQQLTVAHNFDAIIRIPLPAGRVSVENNFSEIKIDDRDVPIVLVDPINVEPLRVFQPAPLRLPTVEKFIPEPIAPFIPADFIAGNSALGYSWHLSVVDGGIPRGVRGGEMLVAAPSNLFNVSTWVGAEMDQTLWTLVGEYDQPPRMPQFGAEGGVPIAGDFNGDGHTEIGVFLNGEWFIDINGNGLWDEGDLWAQLGAEGDKPVVGDWDGDGKDDIGIFGPARPGDPRAVKREPGLPHSLNKVQTAAKNLPPRREDAALVKRMMKVSVQGALRADLIDHVFNYGVAGDRAVAGDWAGNGVDCIGVFRNGVWHLDMNGDGLFDKRDKRAEFGRKDDVPVVGDWNGDGIDELAIYRAGEWILDTNRNYRVDAEDKRVAMGGAADQPVAGDWDGDGRDQIGLMHEGRVEQEARR